MTGERRLVSINAVADYLGVNPRTVVRMIGTGELRAYRLGDRVTIRIDLADVDHLLRPVTEDDDEGA